MIGAADMTVVQSRGGFSADLGLAMHNLKHLNN